MIAEALGSHYEECVVRTRHAEEIGVEVLDMQQRFEEVASRARSRAEDFWRCHEGMILYAPVWYLRWKEILLSGGLYDEGSLDFGRWTCCVLDD